MVGKRDRMPLNMKKTCEMVVRGNVSRPLPDPIPTIERKTWLRILGITLPDNPCNWDLHFEELIKQVCEFVNITVSLLNS